MKAEPIQPRVLVVDDDSDSCDILLHLLGHLGYMATCTCDSHAALTLLHERYDAVLLDLVMPGLNGFDLLHALKAGAAQAPVPVIAVSAHSEFRYRARELGFHAFIEKPVELAKLRPIMAQLLPAV